MSIESMMPSNKLILCHPLLLLPSIFPSIRVFSNEKTLRIRWPKYWSVSFGIPSNEFSGFMSFRFDWLDLLAVSTINVAESATDPMSMHSALRSHDQPIFPASPPSQVGGAKAEFQPTGVVEVVEVTTAPPSSHLWRPRGYIFQFAWSKESWISVMTAQNTTPSSLIFHCMWVRNKLILCPATMTWKY